jgi:hypothetical protein
MLHPTTAVMAKLQREQGHRRHPRLRREPPSNAIYMKLPEEEDTYLCCLRVSQDYRRLTSGDMKLSPKRSTNSQYLLSAV